MSSVPRRHKNIPFKMRGFSLLINPKICICGGNAAFSVFPLTCAAEKHIVSEKPLNKRFFKNTGVVLAGIERSPKIHDFRASGIPVQERVDFFDTLNPPQDEGDWLLLKRILLGVHIEIINKCAGFGIFDFREVLVRIQLIARKLHGVNRNIRAMVGNALVVG